MRFGDYIDLDERLYSTIFLISRQWRCIVSLTLSKSITSAPYINSVFTFSVKPFSEAMYKLVLPSYKRGRATVNFIESHSTTNTDLVFKFHITSAGQQCVEYLIDFLETGMV